MESLIPLFEGSLSPDTSIRTQAEAQLRSFQHTPGFLTSLLTVVAQDVPPGEDPNLRNAIRQSAAVFLKNRIHRAWVTSDQPVPQQDRDFVRQNVLEALVHSPSRIRSLLTPALSVMINSDFPALWPDLTQRTIALMNSSQFSAIEAGLFTLIELMRSYRWTREGKREVPNEIVVASFPSLLALTQKLVSGDIAHLQPAPPSTAEANGLIGTLIYLSMKAYKMSIMGELSPHQQETIVPWGQLLLGILQRRLGDMEGMPEDADDRERWGWWKAKKWACYSLNRLHSRYGSPTHLTNSLRQYKAFADRFIAFFAPEILKAYLHEIDLRISGQQWMSRKVTCHAITFLEESIKPKETWVLLKPHIPTLIDRFMFPLIHITADEVVEFEEEPTDYIRSHFGDFVEDMFMTPSTVATGFVVALASGRKKTSFMALLEFINGVCSKYPAERSPAEKDGALRMLGHLSPIICETKKLRADIEKFFVAFVFPEFKSPHAFLRCRACETVQLFESFNQDWEDDLNLMTAYEGIMACFFDPALPVRIQAALSLPDLADYSRIRDHLTPNIGRIMQELLKLSNQADLDSLTHATRMLVSLFSTELLPFAADLSASLHQSYLRVMTEVLDGRKGDADEYEEDDASEEKVLVAMNILKTLQQLVVGLEGNDQTLLQVETACLPLVEFTLQHNFIELFDEAFELLDSIQFALKSISPGQWRIFDMLYHTFTTNGVEFLAEMFPSFDNYVTYGAAALGANPSQRHKVFEIYLKGMTDTRLGCSDRIVACKLADSVLLAMRGLADDGIPTFIEQSMGVVRHGITTEEPVVTRALLMHAIETVLQAIYYSPALSLAILLEKNWTSEFFTEWFSNLSSLNRAHDKKIAILAICGILQTCASQPPGSALSQSAGQLVIGAVSLFAEFPEAMQKRVEAEEEFESSDEEDEAGADDDDGDDDDKDANEDGDVNLPILDVTNSGFLDRASGAGSTVTEDGSAWTEEILWETPLDSVDAYAQFAATMNGLESSHVFAVIMSHIDDVQGTKLQQIMQQAADGGEVAIKAAIPQH